MIRRDSLPSDMLRVVRLTGSEPADGALRTATRTEERRRCTAPQLALRSRDTGAAVSAVRSAAAAPSLAAVRCAVFARRAAVCLRRCVCAAVARQVPSRRAAAEAAERRQTAARLSDAPLIVASHCGGAPSTTLKCLGSSRTGSAAPHATATRVRRRVGRNLHAPPAQCPSSPSPSVEWGWGRSVVSNERPAARQSHACGRQH